MSDAPSTSRGRRMLAVAATGTAAVLALAGCGGTSGPDSGDTGDLLSSVDTMFGTIDIPQPADGELTVVALGWSDAEAALALGVQPVGVYDWLGFGESGKGVGSWATELFGDVTPEIILDAGDELDYEQIQALDPDLILNTRSANDETQFERLSEIAPTVYAPGGTAAYGTAWDVQTQLVADALGKSDEGAALIADVEAQIAAEAASHPEFAGLVATSGVKFGDAYGAYIAGDARWDVLEELGFTQNPAVLALPASGFFTNISAEQVGALDSDVTVLFPIGYTLADLEADPLIASLAVVQDGRAVFLDAASGAEDATPEAVLSQAFSAASILSIPVALDGIVPLLADAAAKQG